MPQSLRFRDRKGLAPDFFEPYKIAHFAVEAPIEEVSSTIAVASQFFPVGDDQLRLERDVFGRERGGSWPMMNVFQLSGQTWTQAAADIRTVKGLRLARFLSLAFATRCLCIEVTDDAYYSHALFERGTVDELVLAATNLDIKRILESLALEVPAEYRVLGHDDWDRLEEAEYDYRRDGSATRDAEVVAAAAGCYLHTPFSPQGTLHGVHDLSAGDLVRLDVIWADAGD